MKISLIKQKIQKFHFKKRIQKERVKLKRIIWKLKITKENQAFLNFHYHRIVSNRNPVQNQLTKTLKTKKNI